MKFWELLNAFVDTVNIKACNIKNVILIYIYRDGINIGFFSEMNL